ncbi:M60 family metallopeptidase [Pedobacter nyackensis]|uniref:M60 family metallopeptidase n=1 Tax=Pedobacter nyackensis TaxID=475255 RepID=UPI00292E260C|nr:M60 family metallopeptidase [Pedobacter nyackensis]
MRITLNRFSLIASVMVLFLFSCKKNTTEQKPDPIAPVVPDKVQDVASLEFKELTSADLERSRLQLNWLATDFSATGLYIPPTAKVKVNVELKAGSRAPLMLIGTYSRYGKWNSEPKAVQLKLGLNEFQNPGEGLVWIRYTTDQVPNGIAKVSFSGDFKKVPHFIGGKTTNAEWQSMLLKYTEAPDVILEGEKCYIVVSRKNAVTYSDDDQSALVKKIAEVITIQDDYSGLDGSTALDKPNVHQKYLLTEHEDASLYYFAYHYRTAYIGYDVQYILRSAAISDSWGLWHELGHVHQHTWTWGTITEVSVNIYSLAVQRVMAPNKHRLAEGGIWGYAAAYLAKPNAGKDFNNDTSVGVESGWVRLCMFEQLRLAFGDDFYPKLLKKTRKDKREFANDIQKMDYFMLSACEVSGKDLSTFFRKWGLNTSSSIYSTIGDLKLPQPAQDITLLRDIVSK